jgi:seryl-tRNA synthetase
MSSGAANQSPRPGVARRNSSWANKSRRSSNSRTQSYNQAQKKDQKHKDPLDAITNTLKRGLDDVARPIRDIESQVLPASNLFDNIDDELADVEPTARQKLIKRSFQHPASRAIQPAVWIPHDDLGIAKDEIQRTSAFTKRVWITSVNARLDAAGKVIYRGLPPDRDPFENIEV